jgi:glucosamine--fructose-6-phosphate aminotransferase (isomerizing)
VTVRTPEDTLMFAEAAEAPDVVRRQFEANAPLVQELGRQLRAKPPSGVVTLARGSSDHAATFAKYLIETRARVLTTSEAPSIASIYVSAPKLTDMLALTISQSGKSPDIIAATDAAKAAGAFAVAFVNAEGSPLSEATDVTIPLHAGAERSVAATKSYVASLAALVNLVAEWTGDDELREALSGAPDLLAEAWQQDWSALIEALVEVSGLYVIGRGPGLGIAQEAALKFKETCTLHAEAFSAAEVRHGPMALVGPDFPLLVFRQGDETGAGIDELVRDVVARRGRVFLVGGKAEGALALPTPPAHPLIEPMLQILAFYRAVNALAVARGLDPDRPPHLAKVTETL